MDKTTTSQDIVQMFQESKNKGDIEVGNDVWIGMESSVMPGIKIGNGAIIAAKSVVTKDVEPYTIVAGNPARVVRKRFDADTIQTLQKIKWWDWDTQKIEENVDTITGGDIEALAKLAI